jgi:aminoglycoside phosphotransferase (APT) family kinase protein
MSQSVLEKIQTAFAAEEKRGVQPVTELDQVPTGYDALTPQWLSKVLCRDAAGAAVTSFRLDAKDDGSSNRRRVFLDYNEAGRAAKLPATVFCKAAEGLANRVVLGLSGTAEAEADFYNLVRHRLPIEAPVAYYAGFDPSNYSYFIMMRDMAGSATFPDDRTELTWEQAVGIVETLAGLHAYFYESPELGTPTMPFRTWPVWWADQMACLPTYQRYCDLAVEDAEHVIPSRLFQRRAEIWPRTGDSVDRHRVLPRTFIHDDVHMKNWFITSDGRMGLHDWQIVSVGHWSRDLIYALTTSLTIEQRRKWLDELLRLYVDRMEALGAPKISVDEARHNCRQQLFSVLAFWTITLRPAEGLPDMQPERTTYEYIKRLTAAMDDLNSLDSFNN